MALALGLGALCPLLLWIAPLGVALIAETPGDPDALNGLFAALYLGMWLGIGLTAIFVPTLLGMFGLVVALRDVRLRRDGEASIAATLSVLALVVGTYVSTTIWLGP